MSILIMNREEIINQAASEYTENYGYFNVDLDDVECGFIDGAEWADKHPASLWHSVAEGDLPTEQKGDAVDLPFLVRAKGVTYLTYYAWYEDEDAPEFYDDCDCPIDVDYWMEIPELPTE